MFKVGFAVIATICLMQTADAQRRRNTRNDANSGQAANNGQPVGTSNNNQPVTNFNSKLPISYDSSAFGSSSGPGGKSLRPDNAFGFKDSILNERTPLPYEFLRLDDALYSETVWRELDLREKMNQTFNYKVQEDNGDQQFVSIVLKAVQDGKLIAFADERFTTPLSLGDVNKLASGGSADTNAVYDLKDMSLIRGYKITPKPFKPEDIKKIRLKENWIFDREISRMVCRINAIAFLKTEYFEGTTREQGTSIMFWVYYPELRPTLARYEVYNAKNMGAQRMTWEELFESRMFSSYITKSTLDNPSNRNIKQMMKDPILALLEGDNIKERIFNYEQDLWSY